MTATKRHRCPECHEPARKREYPIPALGWALNMPEERRRWVHHLDDTPLCPVMTGAGYLPALPQEA